MHAKYKKIDKKDVWQSGALHLHVMTYTVCLFGFFMKKFQKVAEEVARLHDEFYTNKTLQEMAKVSTLYKLGSKYYSDSDLVDTLPLDLEFNR